MLCVPRIALSLITTTWQKMKRQGSQQPCVEKETYSYSRKTPQMLPSPPQYGLRQSLQRQVHRTADVSCSSLAWLSYYIISYYVMLCYIIVYQIIVCNIIAHHSIRYFTILSCNVLCYISLYQIILDDLAWCASLHPQRPSSGLLCTRTMISDEGQFGYRPNIIYYNTI